MLLLAGCAASAGWGGAAQASPDPSTLAAPLRLGGSLQTSPHRQSRRRLWTDQHAAELDAALGGANRHGIEVGAAQAMVRQALSSRSGDDILNRVALSYGAALARGLVNPATVFSIYTIPRNRYDVASGLLRALRTGTVGAWLDGLAPQDDEYGRLSSAYVEACRVSDTPPAIPIPAGPTIRAGDIDPRTAQVAARLGVSLDADRQTPAAPTQTGVSTTPAASDASSTVGGPAPTSPLSAPGLLNGSPSHVYGPTLVNAVKAFQRANGLRTDGSIGPDTLAVLNAGPADHARMLALNLERRRWLPRQPSTPRIDVNIPGQTLVYYKDGETAWVDRVAVGRPDDQTPDIQARFDDLVVNPPWNVPNSIIRSEIRLAGPGYIQQHHMHWTSHGLVQTPGPWAALGLVKFDLHDPYDIYLHDTPVKGVFDDSARDLSHGCVRVEGAVAFARKLADADGRAGRFDEALASGRTQTVSLGSAITVRLLYHTAFVDDAGQVTYRPDIYGRDAELAAALRMG